MNTRIDEYLDILEGLYRNYCENPSWRIIQLIAINAYYFGKEVGRQQIINDRVIFERSR